MQFTDKQKQVWRETIGNQHRWNICGGAVRSGKTYLDLWKIPYRLRAVKDLPGLKVLLGNTQSTLDRNVLEPMREIWGDKLVGRITVNNRVNLFGVECYALGTDSARQLKRAQGGSWAYGYGDEIPTWHPDVFTMTKSRLDKEYSTFDGTYNPDHPSHWFKQFLDSDADIYQMHFTIDDNPFLPPSFVANLKREYANTIYYDRYILGKWCAGEGAIYRIFIEKKSEFIKSAEEVMQSLRPDLVFIGIDFGGNKSSHAFVASGIHLASGSVILLRSEKIAAKDVTPDQLFDLAAEFVGKVQKQWGWPTACYPDNAEQTLINGLRSKLSIPVQDCVKGTIKDRILLTLSLMNRRKWVIVTNECASIEAALENAVWDSKAKIDQRLDDGTTDIDTLDAMEYSFNHASELLIG